MTFPYQGHRKKIDFESAARSWAVVRKSRLSFTLWPWEIVRHKLQLYDHRSVVYPSGTCRLAPHENWCRKRSTGQIEKIYILNQFLFFVLNIHVSFATCEWRLISNTCSSSGIFYEYEIFQASKRTCTCTYTNIFFYRMVIYFFVCFYVRLLYVHERYVNK